jgi:hypothetical protein
MARGLVHHYGDFLPPAISWFSLWLPKSNDQLLLYVPKPSTHSRYQHSRTLSRRKHFGYARHNGEFLRD